MECRPGCSACCVAPSISSPVPGGPLGRPAGLPEGKPAGLPCPQLDAEGLCRLFGSPERPAVCRSLAPNPEMCGSSREEAMAYLEALERATEPG